ncbi:MAG: hypothetical protein M0Z38_00270 [Deltaproteobacteria bacterium]|nr:hypothetical protein [Deltaproteobacteria bacterium]
MKKYALLFLAVLLLAAGAVIPALAGNPSVATATLAYATDNTVTPAVAIPKAVTHLAVYVPTIESSTVYLQVSGDGGTTYADYRSTPNGTNMILTGPAAGTGGYTFDVPGGIGAFTHVKVKCGTGQTADRAFKLFMW